MARILITRTRLQSAAQLRNAFEPEDRVELVSSTRDIEDALRRRDSDEEAALILTGDIREDLDRSAVDTVRDVDAGIAIVALIGEQGEPPPPDYELDGQFAEPADMDEVVLVVRRLIDRKRLQHDLGIVGRSEDIQEVLERIVQIAPVGSTVLITGDSGTGKELVARGLHRLSPRRGRPFIAVNIAALSETLLESELFGHEKGAFTGATSLRKGMFELANSGTIFLDEIAEMPAPVQTKLLRVLEQREFMRVGGSSSIEVDVRVIAATNRDLRHAVAIGDFRRDLYYRLHVLHIDLPPLRDRREDIPLLVREFIRLFSRQHQREFRGITPEALEILVRYDWPGNVRELRNLIESMVVLAPGSLIRAEDIPPEIRGGGGRLFLPTASAPAVPAGERDDGADVVPRSRPGPTPEMEFIFRTLVELKLDVEDLRREFENYKRRHPELVRAAEDIMARGRSLEIRARSQEERESAAEGAGRGWEPTPASRPPGPQAEEDEAAAAPAEPQPEDGQAIVFQPGMTMQELERAAIEATLQAVDGNRRRASEKLGIGERTLYRKLKEYDIDG